MTFNNLHLGMIKCHQFFFWGGSWGQRGEHGGTAAPSLSPFWRRPYFSYRFYARKQLLLSARLSHRNLVRLSVHPSVTRVDQSKMVQDRITKSSPSAAWKTLVSGTVKLFYKFEGDHPERGR